MFITLQITSHIVHYERQLLFTQGPPYNEFGYDEHPPTANRFFRICSSPVSSGKLPSLIEKYLADNSFRFEPSLKSKKKAEQESPPAWTQKAYRPPCSKCSLSSSDRGYPIQISMEGVSWDTPVSRMGTPLPIQTWDGVPPIHTWDGVSPLPEMVDKVKKLPSIILWTRAVIIK